MNRDRFCSWLTFPKSPNAPVQRRAAQRTVRCNRLLWGPSSPTCLGLSCEWANQPRGAIRTFVCPSRSHDAAFEYPSKGDPRSPAALPRAHDQVAVFPARPSIRGVRVVGSMANG
jgi:hypothetical protein